MVQVDHPAVPNGLTLSYGTGGTYVGFDQFGRVIDQNWLKVAGAVDRYRYGYDRASNRTWRENELTHPGGWGDQFYEYDGLDRMSAWNLCALSTSHTIGTLQGREEFYYDALGNWMQYKYDPNGSGWALNQTRTHNEANEMTAINSTGTNLEHDAAGNMTKIPLTADPTAGHFTCTYDAWNRQTSATDAAGASVIARYFYDGANRRIAKAALNPTGTAYDRTDYYYNESWQVLEERRTPNLETLASATSATATLPYVQYLWDLRYIDAVVCRWRDADGNGGTGLEECLYYTNDANMNVMCLVDSATGTVVERYAYHHGYGQPQICAPDWSGRSFNDAASKKNEILYCGYRYDPETGQYHVRHRYYNPTLGRWVSRDIGEVSPEPLYESCNGNPVIATDPTGEVPIVPGKEPRPVKPSPNRAESTERESLYTSTDQSHCFAIDLTFQGQPWIEADGKRIMWQLKFMKSPGYGASCYCCKDGSEGEIRFVQRLERRDWWQAPGRPIRKVEVSGLDHISGGRAGQGPQPEYRPGVRTQDNDTEHASYFLEDQPAIGTQWEEAEGRRMVNRRAERAGSSMLFTVSAYRICKGENPALIDKVDFGFALDYVAGRTVNNKDLPWIMYAASRTTRWEGGPAPGDMAAAPAPG